MSVELHVEVAGTGPPVVLLHAFPLDSRMWAATRTTLSERFRVVTPDLRGFGSSPLGTDTPSVDAMADDVVDLLDRMGLDRVVLGGLSLGGYVAMAFLRRHADRARAVILADTKAGADPQAARDNRERIARTALSERSARVVVDDVLPVLLGETTVRQRPHVASAVRSLVEAAQPESIAWAQRAMAARPDSFDVLRALAVPVLVVVGDEDQVSPPADAEAMAEAAPLGRLAVLAGAGHLSAMETPELFATSVGAFVSACP
jgi:pimeloyl-ACP methyl ester carboxylesterase